MKNLESTIVLLIIFYLTALMGKTIETENLIVIDRSIEYQTIENFGASDAWSCDPVGKEWDELVREEIADLLFNRENGIGLSLWRFNIGAGLVGSDRIQNSWRSAECFWNGLSYDWDRQSGQQWFLRAAKQRGVDQFLAFVNSPPKSMTKNGYTNCDQNVGSTNLKYGYENNFATFLCDIIEHFKEKKGILFNYLAPVNEPAWEWNQNSNQEGCRYNNSDIKRVINALYDELDNRQLPVTIDAVENGEPNGNWNTYNKEFPGTYGNYMEEFLGDPEIRNKIGNHISGHSYWQSDLSTIDVTRERIAREIEKYPGAKYWMTEWCSLRDEDGGNSKSAQRDTTMDFAIQMARIIHYDLSVAGAVAWHFWTAISKENWRDGLIYVNEWEKNRYYVAKSLWALGHYSRFIRPGSKRIDCEGANDKNGLMASAYYNPNENSLISVIINSSQEAKTIFLSLDNSDHIDSLIPYLTNDEGNSLSVQKSIKMNEPYIIPTRSIVTFVGEYEKNDSNNVANTQIQNLLVLSGKVQYRQNSSSLIWPKSENITKITILTLSGRVVFKSGNVMNRNSIKVPKFSNGMHLVNVKYDNKISKSLKIIFP